MAQHQFGRILAVAGDRRLLGIIAQADIATGSTRRTVAVIEESRSQAELKWRHTMEPFTLTSSTFEDGGMIPENCTCDGANQSPALQWGGAPLKTQSFVLIVDDPDAPKGVFTHWVLFDIPKSMLTLDAGQPVVGRAGINDFQQPGYSGPCPPPRDRPHGYRFTLYALDVPTLGLGQRATRREVEGAMQDHIIARAQLTGRYQRHERSARA